MNNLKFRLRIYIQYRPCDLDRVDMPPTMDSLFDSYEDVIIWLNTHMGLNFGEKSYKITITTMEV